MFDILILLLAFWTMAFNYFGKEVILPKLMKYAQIILFLSSFLGRFSVNYPYTS